MKRKKFIKMLMAHGIGRDAAKAAAFLACMDRVPYTKALGDFLVLCWIRTYNALWGGDVFQRAEANVWVGVLTHE